jgi:hypothetical protein
MANPSGDHITPGGFVFSRRLVMFDNLDLLDNELERRLIGRTKVAKGALLFFGARSGVHSCFVRDVTNVGAGVRTHDLPIVPLNFDLSFDNFRTIRKCQLIWREADFIGLAFLS